MGGGVGFARAHHHALISLQALAGNAWITLQTFFFQDPNHVEEIVVIPE